MTILKSLSASVVVSFLAAGSAMAQQPTAPTAERARTCTSLAHEEIMNRNCMLPSLQNGPVSNKSADQAQGRPEPRYDALQCRVDLVIGYENDCLDLGATPVIKRVPTSTPSTHASTIVGAFRAPEVTVVSPAVTPSR